MASGVMVAPSLRYRVIDWARGTHAMTELGRLRQLQYAPVTTLLAAQEAHLELYFKRLQASPLFSTVKQFEDLPVIDKAYINRHRDALLNPQYRGKLFRKKTGGSTGEPLAYVTGSASQSALWAGIYLAWEIAGWQPGDRVAFLAGSSLFGAGWRQNAYYRLMRVGLMSAFDMSVSRMDDYLVNLASGGYGLMYGYASAIHRLACHQLTKGRPLRSGLKGIVCTAEVLTMAMRSDIEAGLNAPCFNQYGCNDAGLSAFECEYRQGLHLLTTRCHAEVLDGGRLIATDLSNDAMFMPRYDTGDIVRMAPSSCPCGRNLPLISEVVGRQNDFVVDPLGRAVHSEFFTHLFREDTRVKSFQVTFDSHALQINLHRHAGHTDSSVSFEMQYRERVAASLSFPRIDFLVDEAFMTLRNGKHRFVIRKQEGESDD